MTVRPLLVDRYAIYDRIAAGGMATVHLGRLVGERGFSRTVAIKRLHPHLSLDPEFVAMFLDEARLAARIRHPNVVQTLDVVCAEGEIFLVMEYIEGESMASLFRVMNARNETMPAAHAAALMAPVLHGLHAAHEAKNDQGQPLALVHRDVSPQNVLVGIDGIPRVLDFGVAKALGQSHSTRTGELKGKLAYMSPEQIEGHAIDRRTDVFAAAVVLWECLAGRRLFKADSDAQVMRLVLHEAIPPPSVIVPGIPPEVDAVVMTGLARDRDTRYATAEEMADALEEAVRPTASRKLAAWVQERFNDRLIARAKLVHEIESASTGGSPRGPGEPADTVPAPVAAGAIDVTNFAVEEPAQAPSQASSIAVESRVSLRPGGKSKAPATLLAAGAVLCVGLAAMVSLSRSHDAAPPIAATPFVDPPARSAPQPVTTPPPRAANPPVLAATAPPSISVDRLPVYSPPIAPTPPTPAQPATRPAPVTAAAPPAHPPQPHPAAHPAPAPASTLYSRF